MNDEECYTFTPSVDGVHPGQKGTKRRQSNAKDSKNSFFPALIKGTESDRTVEHRYEMFKNLWLPLEEALRGMIDDANAKTIKAVKSFVTSATESGHASNVPAALIVQGPENGTFTGFSDALCKDLANLERTMCIKLTAAQSPNLRTVLRYVNQAATLSGDELDDANTGSGSILNYDLRRLHRHVERHSLHQVILVFEDSEAFEAALFSDIIDFLKLWNDRVPFVLLFGIATSVEIFQEKLSRNAMMCLNGRKFEIQPVDIDCMFRIVHNESARLCLGAGLSKLINEHQRSFISNAESFVQMVKYAYMAHTFSNPLSIWLEFLTASRFSDQECLEIIRRLPSFRRLLQRVIDAHQYETARNLLNNDTELNKRVLSEAANSLKALKELKSAVNLLFAIRKILQSLDSSAASTWSDLYILAISGELSGSDILTNTLTMLKRLTSDVLQRCLDYLQQETSAKEKFDLRLMDSARDLNDLLVKVSHHTELRSAHDVRLSNVRNTVIAQKVELGRHSTKVMEEETLYTKILDNFVSNVELFLGPRLIDPENIFFHEVFLLNIKNLHRQVFMPRPRYAIERALTSPHDYLGCTCCNNTSTALSTSLPATAIVYQLYLESGCIINIADLWTAFWTIREAVEGNDEDVERKQALALLSKALAELKYLGLIKNRRKKLDHLAKLIWHGL